ncbi:MAG: class I SAM-dependent methyltransferase [Pseudomonadota bacterium]
MLAKDTVETAFRLILGRPPESDAVCEAHCNFESTEALREALFASGEFDRFYRALCVRQERQRTLDKRQQALGGEEGDYTVAKIHTGQSVLLPANAVETATAPEAEARLWARIATSWTGLGREAAHWSVLTHDDFRPGALEDNREDFKRSADVDGLLVDAALQRLPGVRADALHCLEIGCGVGRVTRVLAERFRAVSGADVSAEHLAIARDDLVAAGHKDVDLIHIQRMEDYAALPSHGFFYSRLVLQHNPPPVQAAILRAVFAALDAQGVALFQAVTHAMGYHYSVEDDLSDTREPIEMHPLPQATIFALMAEAGLDLIEVQEDDAAGLDGFYRSHLFLAQKR